MSFRCQMCGTAQKDRSSPIMVIVEQRSKVYPERCDKEGKIIDKGGHGHEIVCEVQACRRCAADV